MQLSTSRWHTLGSVSLIVLLGAAGAVSAELLSTVSSARGVQVAPDSSGPVVSAAPQNLTSEDLETPFGVTELRRFLLAAELPLGAETVEDVRDTLRSCARCLDITAVSDSGGRALQLATVSTAGDAVAFVALAIGEGHDGPEVLLAATGAGISFTPGLDGALVAEEDVYQQDDAVCCPSGSSLQVYRQVNGRYTAGERYVQEAGPRG